ncbi:uncharacterized protein f isoform X11 [Panulirus ornatus]|uniref:uncharacterized protein f isoform X11 n=1 Tax=Panulirus ornatus TaxID=150431 RepID=UPI003A89EC4D
MLDLLLAGLVGLTYTCVQTLFFLNCLNSRRREQRRLDRVCRESLRKINSSVGEALKSKKEEIEKGNVPKNLEENESSNKVENGKEETDDKNTTAENAEDRLVTRLVVKSGKTALPTSQELFTSSHGVNVQNTAVQLDGQTMEDEDDLAGELNEPPSQPKTEVNLTTHKRSYSTLTMATAAGAAAAAPPQILSEYNITVNSNMIEVRDDAHPTLQNIDPIYESVDGGPNSLLTQVTILCEDAEGGHELDSRNSQEFQGQEEERPAADVDEGCNQEDEVDDTHRKLSRLPDINLVTTISQILHSPPESMEPGSENLPLEVLDTTLGSSPTHSDASVSLQSHLLLSEGSECTESRVTVRHEEALKDDSLSQHGESSFRTCDARKLNRIFSSQKDTDGPHGTWTLPRVTRRTQETHGSLPRQRGVVEEEGGRSAPSGNTDSSSPAASHFTRRDEAPEGSDLHQANTLNTCHSTPAMAGVATTPPHTPRSTTTDDHYSEVSCGQTDKGDSGSSMGNLESTCVTSDNHIYSEASGDSLYFTASDHTSCELSSEMRGESDEGFETTVYEMIDSPSTQHEVKHSSVIIKVTVPNPNETVSKERSDIPEDDVESSLYTYGSNIYEEIKSDSETSGEPIAKITLESLDDAYSVGSGSQYENISESDTHGDSGYESPVKADVHSSDDTASTASTSSQDHHYEDIDPSQMVRSSGGEGRARESSRRGRSLKDASKDAFKDAEDQGDEEAVRQRQRLQGLDDLIAGVPPPDYDEQGEPLDDASALPDVCTSGGHQADIAPPPEFGDSGGSSGGCNGTSDASARRHLHSTLSVPPTPSSSGHSQSRTPLLRTISEPRPPPPPPMPSSTPSPKTSPSASHRASEEVDSSSPASSKPSSPRSTHSPLEERDSEGPVEEGVVRPSEFIRRNSQRSEHGSFRESGHKKMDRPMSLPLDVAEHYDKMLSGGKDTTGSQEDLGQSSQQGKTHTINGKSLPFIPPKFPTQPSDSGLIKPSEYLRSLGGSPCRPPSSGEPRSLHTTDNALSSVDSLDSSHSAAAIQTTVSPPCPLPAIPEATEEESNKAVVNAPPPPPAPPAPPSSATNTMSSRNNTLTNGSTNGKTTLPTISVTDLQSVQLRKIENKVAKPTSVRLPMSPEPSFTSAKNDVIAELKMGVDITGIKKLKSERAKEEEINDKLEQEELSRQFSAVKFVDHVPEVDNAGNRIPDWKRQMLARKAAERAKKEAEESRIQEAEEKRLQSIPPWKRQLMMRRDEDGKRSSLYIPKVEDVKKIKVVNTPQNNVKVLQKDSEKENTHPSETQRNSSNSTFNTTKGSSPTVKSSNTTVTKTVDTRQENDGDEEPRMPWRTNLRKTNSKLSLLE